MMNKRLSILILASWFLGNLSIHLLSPVLPALTTEMHSNARMAQLTISLFLFGKAISMLLWGGLSERWGRRPIMHIGLWLYALSNLFAAYTEQMGFLLCCRFLQGCAVGATLLMGRAMINDSHAEKEATQRFAFYFSFAGLFICFLPLLGALISGFGSWRYGFMLMAGYGFLLLLLARSTPETRINLQPQPMTLLPIYKSILQNPLFLGYLCISAFMVAGESAFNTCAPFILIQEQHFSVRHYGLVKTAMLLAHLLGTISCGLLVKHYGSAQLTGIGVRFFALASVLMWLLSGFHQVIYLSLIVPMLVYYFGTGFIVSSATAAAVRPFPQQMAIALAVSLLLQFSLSALSSLLVASLVITSVKPFMFILSLISLSAWLSWTKYVTETAGLVTLGTEGG